MEAKLNLMLNPGKQLTGNPRGLCNSGPALVGRAWVPQANTEVSKMGSSVITPLFLVLCCCCQVTSVVSDSVRPHRRQPTRLPRPWGSPGKNSGVGCHFLLQCMKVKSESEVAQSCPTHSDPIDYSLPGSSVHGIFQARVLEWGAIALSVLVLSRVQLFAATWTVVHQAPLYETFSRQKYWTGLPFPTPGDLPDPGIEAASLMSPALAGRFFTTVPAGKPSTSLCQ